MSSNLNNNIEAMADAIYKNFAEVTGSQYKEIVDYTQYKKLTDAPHEIIIDVTANVMEENEKGELIGTKEICTKQYHIPVPIDKNYHLYMSTFFKHLEGCMATSAQEAEKTEE